MNAIFLGTNGWFETETGNTLCTLIKTEYYDIVLDAGSGFFKLDKYIDGTKPVYLFLSHFHMDHISGLHGLSKINCQSGLSIVDVLELPADKEKIPFGIEFLPLLHSDTCLGYRITVDDRIVTFCTDTGYCANAVKLAQNADLLITECAFLPGEENADWPHLNPETAARIADEAGAKKLVLTHFDAARYLTLKMRMDAENTAKNIFPEVQAATDLLDLEV
jgi:ribonuclease BN (tRNA processing enzyme)